MKNKEVKKGVLFIVILIIATATVSVAVAHNSSSITSADLMIPVVGVPFDEYVTSMGELTAEAAVSDVSGINATITFSSRLSFSELERYVSAYNVEALMLEMRGFMPDGTRVTTGIRVDDISFEEAERMVSKIAYEQSFTVAGVIGMNARVNSSDLCRLQADNLTFLADVSLDVRFQQKSTEGIEGIKPVENRSFPKSLAWELEDLRIIE